MCYNNAREVIFVMKKTAILFDLDGTLLNSLPDIARCMNEVLKANSLPVFRRQITVI